jgi:hypothetical protein
VKRILKQQPAGSPSLMPIHHFVVDHKLRNGVIFVHFRAAVSRDTNLFIANETNRSVSVSQRNWRSYFGGTHARATFACAASPRRALKTCAPPRMSQCAYTTIAQITEHRSSIRRMVATSMRSGGDLGIASPMTRSPRKVRAPHARRTLARSVQCAPLPR